MSPVVLPLSSTSSVKILGSPVAGQGTGMKSTIVPMVVVIVEHASAVAIGRIPPFEILTAGGRAKIGRIGRQERMAINCFMLRANNVSGKVQSYRN